ncbi:MAG: S8 family serine peptidase [Verrucomicrobia bacterium]|nr:S8 family serine peptidase [Verrucomicrobiota bacterium]
MNTLPLADANSSARAHAPRRASALLTGGMIWLSLVATGFAQNNSSASPNAAVATVAPPQLAADSLAGSAGPHFHLHLQGAPFAPYVIQASPDFTFWVSLVTNLAGGDGRLDFTDPQASGFEHRFYRAMRGPVAGLEGGVALGTGGNLMPLDAGGFRPDRILVKPKAGIDLAAVNLLLGTQVLQSFPAMGNLQVLQVPAGQTAQQLIAAYQQSGTVAYAEPDYAVQLLLTPNDFRYWDGSLWALHNTGQLGGTPGADIDAPDAWDLQHTATNIIVAILDTGVRYTHEDLAANMWTQPGGTNHGINALTGSNDPWDDFGHGTHVSGTIGAVGNNSVGIVGVAWTAQLMECKFIDSQGNGSISGAITCINYARDHGAKIINASWGTTNFNSAALHDAIANARDAGIIFVAAAGNSQDDNDGPNAIYPASYTDLDNVISVASTGRNDQLSVYSNYGAKSVHLGAPGQDIFSTYYQNDSNYVAMSGTSMAAAHVSGACAVVWAHYPDETYKQIIARVLNGTDPLPSLAGKTITGGRLNLFKALSGSTSPPPATVTADFTASPTSGTAPLAVQFTDKSNGGITAWDWSFGDGSPDSSTQNPTHTYTNSGTFTVTLTVTGSGGATNSKSATIQVNSTPPPSSPPVANFTANPTSGTAPLAVQFNDKSTGSITAWDWNFGDGSPDSSTQNPTHTYTNAGTFTATLTVTGSGGTTNSKSATIQVNAAPPPPASPPVAKFGAYPISGQAPMTVKFFDQSTGNITAWDWNFGDNSPHSPIQNPTHTYTNAGTFTVTLTVTGSGGATNSTSGTIQVTNPPPPPPPPVANFAASPTSGNAPLTVQFTDKSTGTVSGWDWNFGDGSAHSSTQNPSHTYASAGTYTVTLTVSGAGASSTKTGTIQVNNAPPPPTVTVNTTSPVASEIGPINGQFTLSRSGDTSTALTVNYTLSGNAVNGSDYQQLPASVTFPAGASTATVTVVASSDALIEAPELVTLSLSNDPGYQVGSPSAATVTILNTGLPLSSPLP